MTLSNRKGKGATTYFHCLIYCKGLRLHPASVKAFLYCSKSACNKKRTLINTTLPKKTVFAVTWVIKIVIKRHEFRCQAPTPGGAVPEMTTQVSIWNTSHRREGSPISVKYDIPSCRRSLSPFFSTAKMDFLSSEQALKKWFNLAKNISNQKYRERHSLRGPGLRRLFSFSLQDPESWRTAVLSF